MSLTKPVDGRAIAAFMVAAAAVSLLLASGVLDAALAQTSPFGTPRPQPVPVPRDGFIGWIFAKQAEFYRQFSGLIRAAKTDGSAAWSLFGLSFLVLQGIMNVHFAVGFGLILIGYLIYVIISTVLTHVF